MRFTTPITGAFLVAACLVAFLVGMLWCVGASAQEAQMYGGAPAPHLIARQLASSTTSLNFAPLPTNYTTLLLSCTALLASSSNGCIQLIVGESSGPTWETAADYSVAALNANGSYGVTTGTDIFDLCTNGGEIGNNTGPISFEAWIDGDVSSTSIPKNVIWQYALPYGGADYWTGASNWNKDNNAITGLAVTTTGVTSGSVGTITSGTCTLYGF